MAMAMAMEVSTAALSTSSTLSPPSASTHFPPRTSASTQCSSLCHISRSWELTGFDSLRATEFGCLRLQTVCVVYFSTFFLCDCARVL